MNCRMLSYLKNFFWVLVFFPLISFANEATSGQGEVVSLNMNLSRVFLEWGEFQLFVTLPMPFGN
jgi:hypothetical protein